jgi:hypothetical protein
MKSEPEGKTTRDRGSVFHNHDYRAAAKSIEPISTICSVHSISASRSILSQNPAVNLETKRHRAPALEQRKVSPVAFNG